MNASELKLKLFKQIDTLEINQLQELYGIFKNFLSSNREEKDWNSLSDYEKEGIESAIEEIDSGYGINHDVVLNEYRKKYSDA